MSDPSPNPYQSPQQGQGELKRPPFPLLVTVSCCFLLAVAFLVGFALNISRQISSGEVSSWHNIVLQILRLANSGVLILMGIDFLHGRRRRAVLVGMVFLALSGCGIVFLSMAGGRF